MPELREDYIINIIGQVNINAQDIQRQVDNILKNVKGNVPIQTKIEIRDAQQLSNIARNIRNETELLSSSVDGYVKKVRELAKTAIIETPFGKVELELTEENIGLIKQLKEEFGSLMKITDQTTITTKRYAENIGVVSHEIERQTKTKAGSLRVTEEITGATIRQNRELLAIAKAQELYNERMTRINNIKSAMGPVYEKNLSLMNMEKKALRDLISVIGTDRATPEQISRLKELTLATRDAGGSIDYLKRNIVHVIPKIALWAAGTTTVYGTIRGLIALIKTAIDVQSELAKTRKIMPVNFDIKPLEDFALRIAPLIGMNVTEIIQVMTDFGRVTKDVNEIIEYTKLSLLLTTATGLDNAKATELLTAVMKQYGLTAGQLMTFIDQFNYITNTAIITQEELADALLKSSGTAKQAGLSLTELIVILSVLKETSGLSGAVVGTQLRNVNVGLVVLDKSIEKVSKKYPSLLPPKDVFLTAFQQLKYFATELNKLPFEQRRQAIVEFTLAIAGAKKSIAGVIGLFENITEESAKSEESITRMQRILDTIATVELKSTGSALRELEMVLGTQTIAVAKLKASWQVLGVELARVGILDFLRQMTYFITNVVVAIAEFVKENQKLLTSLMKIGLVTGIILTLTITFNKLISVLGLTNIAFGSLLVSIGTLSSVINVFTSLPLMSLQVAIGLTIQRIVGLIGALKSLCLTAIPTKMAILSLVGVFFALEHISRKVIGIFGYREIQKNLKGSKEEIDKFKKELRDLKKQLESGKITKEEFDRKMAVHKKFAFVEAKQLGNVIKQMDNLDSSTESYIDKVLKLTDTSRYMNKELEEVRKALGIKPEPLISPERLPVKSMEDLKKEASKAGESIREFGIANEETVKKSFELSKQLKELIDYINKLDLELIEINTNTKIYDNTLSVFGDNIVSNNLKLGMSLLYYKHLKSELDGFITAQKDSNLELEKQRNIVEKLDIWISDYEKNLTGIKSKLMKQNEISKEWIKTNVKDIELRNVLLGLFNKEIISRNQLLLNAKEELKEQREILTTREQLYSRTQQMIEKLTTRTDEYRDNILKLNLAISDQANKYALANLKSDESFKILGNRIRYIDDLIQNQEKIISDYVDNWVELEKAKLILERFKKEAEGIDDIVLKGDFEKSIKVLTNFIDGMEKELRKVREIEVEEARINIIKFEFMKLEETLRKARIDKEISKFLSEGTIGRLKIEETFIKNQLDATMKFYLEHYDKLNIIQRFFLQLHLKRLSNMEQKATEEIEKEQIRQRLIISYNTSLTYTEMLQAISQSTDDIIRLLKDSYDKQDDMQRRATLNTIRNFEIQRREIQNQIRTIDSMTSAWKNFFLTVMMGEKTFSEALKDLGKTIRKTILEQQLEEGIFKPLLEFLGITTAQFVTPVGRDVDKAFTKGADYTYNQILKGFIDGNNVLQGEMPTEVIPTETPTGKVEYKTKIFKDLENIFGKIGDDIKSQLGKDAIKIGDSLSNIFSDISVWLQTEGKAIIQNIVTAGGIAEMFGKVIPSWVNWLTGILSLIPTTAPYAGIIGGIAGIFFGKEKKRPIIETPKLEEAIDDNTRALKQLDLTLNEIMEKVINAPPQFVYPVMRGIQLPSLQGGGYVQQTGVAVVHRGEYVTKAPNININISGNNNPKEIAKEVIREIERYYPKSRSRIGSYTGIIQ